MQEQKWLTQLTIIHPELGNADKVISLVIELLFKFVILKLRSCKISIKK